MENENTSFANISIPFLEHDLKKEMEILAKLVLSFFIIVFMMKLLVILFIMKLIAQINILYMFWEVIICKSKINAKK